MGVSKMTPEEHARELERIERVHGVSRREIRQRESGSTSDKQEIQFYQTTKVPDNQSKGGLLKPKVILGLKLFGVGVVAIALVRVAAVVANLLIVGTLLFVGYKLFFEKKK
ncbi:hypothetical protein NIES4071_03030 [Calothrix sp. NIES-4071]|nr:hypothetical protein NIES4071_03030 [Calothrix sp. NIES-4071]BAZ54649.1 hypothetical protein NIES4105_03020 [Calothrix sp. NIES-4105]